MSKYKASFSGVCAALWSLELFCSIKFSSKVITIIGSLFPGNNALARCHIRLFLYVQYVRIINENVFSLPISSLAYSESFASSLCTCPVSFVLVSLECRLSVSFAQSLSYFLFIFYCFHSIFSLTCCNEFFLVSSVYVRSQVF